MITWIYRIILALIVAIVIWNLFVPGKTADEQMSVKDTITFQLNCALVIIPLVLRVLMIK